MDKLANADRHMVLLLCREETGLALHREEGNEEEQVGLSREADG